jgi:hypothetical protein
VWGMWNAGFNAPSNSDHNHSFCRSDKGQAKHPFDAAGSTPAAAPCKSLLQKVNKMSQDGCVCLCDLSNFMQVHLLECHLIIAVADAQEWDQLFRQPLVALQLKSELCR